MFSSYGPFYRIIHTIAFIDSLFVLFLITWILIRTCITSIDRLTFTSQLRILIFVIFCIDLNKFFFPLHLFVITIVIDFIVSLYHLTINNWITILLVFFVSTTINLCNVDDHLLECFFVCLQSMCHLFSWVPSKESPLEDSFYPLSLLSTAATSLIISSLLFSCFELSDIFITFIHHLSLIHHLTFFLFWFFGQSASQIFIRTFLAMLILLPPCLFPLPPCFRQTWSLSLQGSSLLSHH